MSKMHVYGTRCSYHAPKDKLPLTGGLPVCPHCRNVLFEMPQAEWNSSTLQYAETVCDPGYIDFIKWSENRECIPLIDKFDLQRLRNMYEEDKKKREEAKESLWRLQRIFNADYQPETHVSYVGVYPNPPEVGKTFFFVYKDGRSYVRLSTVQFVQGPVIVTRNSVYILTPHVPATNNPAS